MLSDTSQPEPDASPHRIEIGIPYAIPISAEFQGYKVPLVILGGCNHFLQTRIVLCRDHNDHSQNFHEDLEEGKVRKDCGIDGRPAKRFEDITRFMGTWQVNIGSVLNTISDFYFIAVDPLTYPILDDVGHDTGCITDGRRGRWLDGIRRCRKGRIGDSGASTAWRVC